MRTVKYGSGGFYWQEKRVKCVSLFEWHRLNGKKKVCHKCGAKFNYPEGYLLVTPVGLEKWRTMTSKGWVGLPVGFLMVSEG